MGIKRQNSVFGGLAAALLVILILSSWMVNLMQFVRCDFEPGYRCEALHGIGLVPAFAPITVWFKDDSD